MSFIAAVLLLNMDVDDAFICFANLLNQPCQIAFFRLDETLVSTYKQPVYDLRNSRIIIQTVKCYFKLVMFQMKSYFDTYEEFFCENLPKLYSHFKKQSLSPDLYIIDW